MASAVKIVTALSSSKSSPSIISGRRRSKLVCEVVPQISPHKDNVARVSRNFGRLKVQRVKEIVKESYMKREQSDQLKDDDDGGGGGSKDEVSPSREESGELDVFETPKVRSRFSRSIDRSGERHFSSSKWSADSSKRWGSVPSVDTYRPKTDTVSKKGTKSKASGDFFSIKSFKEVGCGEHVIESLNKLQYERPSHIQAMAFKQVLEGKSCIVADQSGSGKTLAYLAPLMQRLRQEELEGLSKAASQSPRTVILVPTAELASQVLSVCRSLSKAGVPVRSMVATGGFRQKTQLENLREEIDVVIATPGRFMFLVKEGFLQLTNLRSVVLDEVDILYNDEDFELALNSLVNTAPVTAQYIFVTATLPVDIYYKLVEVFPDSEVIMGPGVHRTSPRLQEFLIDCSGAAETERTPESAFLNKKNALVQLVGESQAAKTIVFCNKIETCRKVENVLKRLDRKGTSLKVLPFHAALEQDSRLANMEEFRKSSSNNTLMILVCTDRASRGIDFSGVDHVVLFDFPRDPSEYVRRVGRTARGASGEGKAFILAVGKQVALARRIIERNQKGHPLHDVPSAYEATR